MSEDQPRTLLATITRTDDHPALARPGAGALSYAEVHDAVDAFAGQLGAVGVGAGDTVALSVGNGPPFVVAFLGIVAAGAAAAPLNPAYTEQELLSYLDDLRPQAMVVDGGARDAAVAAARQLELPVHRLGADARLADVTSAAAHDTGTPESVALLLHTSGTTSRPKLVPLRQRNLARSARTIAATYGLGEDDVSHCVMPLFHVHGLVASTLATLASGGTVVIPERFSPGAFWEDGARAGATWYSAVPTIHQKLLARARDADAPAHGLRFARSCSSALAEPLWAEFEDRFQIPLVEAYGMTEATHQMASNPLPPGERRPRTVGVATGVEVAVLDDAWRPVAAGESGEVSVRGRSVVDGYRDRPEANAEAFRDGWFRTGDRGRLSGDGYLTLDGRLKELINRGGEKISPHEVEEALLSHPAVAEAVAFAAPDAKLGERVGAAVVVRATNADERALQLHCADRLAAFKVPAFIAIVDAIPTGPTGKIQRRAMAGLLAS
jgi:acyl-CoA synthetase (AMP-forming)/AMP-acid ligase II